MRWRILCRVNTFIPTIPAPISAIWTSTAINLTSEAEEGQAADREVQIYRRASGEVGIRNELWILPTVGCVNGIARQIQTRFLKETNNAEGTDGVHLFSHTYGCSQLGDDHINTRTMLQNMVRHPNAGAVLVIGLGCENNQVDAFRDTLGEFDPERVHFMVCQHRGRRSGSGRRTTAPAVRGDASRQARAGQAERTEVWPRSAAGLTGFPALPLTRCWAASRIM